MPLPDPPAQGAGGVLEMEYANAAAGARVTLKWHLCHFDQVPSGADNDYAYTGTGPVVPTETSVLQTFAAIGALWAPYYRPSWELRLLGLHWALAEGEEALPETPVATPIVGTSTAPSDNPCVNRIFRLRSVQHVRRRHWLARMPDDVVDTETEVSPTGGGFDARDQAWMNYLAGNTGGAVVAPDGHRFEAVADLRRWWAKRLEPLPVGDGGGGGAGGVLTTDCLTYPLGATLCNPSGDVVTLQTAAGHFVFDGTGITLPGGHRLEVV